MATKLIEFEDGTLVEVEVPGEQVEQISGGMAERVNSSLEKIRPILINTCKPIIESWTELNQVTNIKQAEIKLGLSFEGEGNVYITKVTTGANLTVKLILRPKKGGSP